MTNDTGSKALGRSTRDIIQLILAIGWRRRYVICVSILVMPFVGLIASFLAPKNFEARMTILVQEPGRMNPFLNDIAIGTNVKDRMPALSALLRSEHMLARVLMDMGEMSEDVDAARRQQLVSRLASSISAQLTGAELVELRLRGAHPAGLGRRLETIGARFIDRLVSPERGALATSEAFLEEQLKRRMAALDNAETVLAEFRRQNAEKLPAIYNTSVQRLAATSQRLEEKRAELAAAESLFEDVRKRLVSTNPVVGKLEESIVQVSSELAGMRSRYMDDHSDVRAAERKLVRLQEERQSLLDSQSGFDEVDIERLWNMAASRSDNERTPAPLLMTQMQRLQEAQSRRTLARQDVENLQKSVDEMKRTISQFGPIEQQQRRLERSVENARELYDALAKRSEMAKLTSALGRYETPERIKIIDPPADPTSPVTPGRMVFILLALVAGIGLGCGLAAALEPLDPTLRSEESIERIAGVRVIASVERLTARA